MIQTFMLDRCRLESVITGFRESELYVPGFKVLDVAREANSIVWDLYYEAKERETWTHCFLMLDDQKIVEISGSIDLMCGDSLKIKYTLNWFYRGGDDDMVVLPAPAPGMALEFISVAA